MKVLFITPKSVFSGKPFGGAEKSMHDMALFLAQLGHHVSFISSQDFVRFGKAKRFVEKGIHVHLLPVFRLPLLRIPFFRSLNYKIRGSILRKYLSRFFDDVEIIYTYNELPTLYQLARWKSNRTIEYPKLVYRSAGVFWSEGIKENRPGYEQKLRFSLKAVDLANFNCEGMKQLFYDTSKDLNLPFQFSKELVLDIGTDLTSVTKFWKYQKRDTFDIVMVARFDNFFKRQDLLIEAFEKWGNQKARLIFLGDGPAKDELELQCRSNEFLRDRVVFKGFVSKEVILNHLVKCSCAALATMTEGMSKSIAESMATGTPIIASNVLAINTYIQNGHNGILTDNTVDDWVLALERVNTSSESEMQFLSANARDYAVKNLDSKVNIAMLEKAFEDLISRR